MTTDFFSRLPLLTRFSDITDLNAYRPLPVDWTIFVCDVRGSTRAIAEGRYKEVNLVGAATITAALNIAGDIEIPFVFGGDGSSIAVPPALAEATAHTLSAVSALSQQAFNLELRVGAVPMTTIISAGYQVLVGRFALTHQVAQAVFTGGGISYAEKLIKDEAYREQFLIASGNADEARLDGLECRWDTIPPPHDAVLCLIVQVTPQLDPEASMTIYRSVIETIEQIYGDEQAYHPLRYNLMQASANPRSLWPEARLRGGDGRLAQLTYWAHIYGLNLGVRGYRWLQRLRGEDPWWDRYRQHVTTAADYRKYDDTLRMIISGINDQHAQLLSWLTTRTQTGELVFGAHRSPEVMLTCLIFERMGRQIHFVDGADGGFTLAARDLKQRLRTATPVSTGK